MTSGISAYHEATTRRRGSRGLGASGSSPGDPRCGRGRNGQGREQRPATEEPEGPQHLRDDNEDGEREDSRRKKRQQPTTGRTDEAAEHDAAPRRASDVGCDHDEAERVVGPVHAECCHCAAGCERPLDCRVIAKGSSKCQAQTGATLVAPGRARWRVSVSLNPKPAPAGPNPVRGRRSWAGSSTWCPAHRSVRGASGPEGSSGDPPRRPGNLQRGGRRSLVRRLRATERSRKETTRPSS